MKRPEIAHSFVTPYTGEWYFAYETPMPNIAKTIVVCLALTIPFWVMS